MIRVLKAGTITSTLGCFSPGNSIAMETNQEHSSCRGLRAGVGGGGVGISFSHSQLGE